VRLLEVRGITVYYGAVKALEEASLRVEEGEIVALIGPNGAGKSTMLKAICGLLPFVGGRIEGGDITFMGESIKGIPAYKLIRKGISIVPEGRRIFPTMTVLENLEIAVLKMNGRKKKELMEEVFELFPILGERRRQKAGTLSGGEQQMLAIGRALMLKPKLLVLDEPSLGLSPDYTAFIFDKIKELNRKGTSVLIAEQNVRMVLDISDRAYLFKMGKVVLSGPSGKILEHCQGMF